MRSVVIGYTIVDGYRKYRVLSVKEDFSGLVFRDIPEDNIMEELNNMGISKDYELTKSGLYTRDTNNLHIIQRLDLSSNSETALEYVLVSINKANKTAIAFDIIENKLVKGSLEIMSVDKTLTIKLKLVPRKGEVCKKLKYGLKSCHCNNVWIDDNGNFSDEHYIEVKHSKIGTDVYVPTIGLIRERHKEYNARIRPLGTSQIKKPENVLNIKDTDNTVKKTQDKKQEHAENDDELSKYYDSNGNCIDFDGLSAYLDKKRLDKLNNKSNSIEEKMERPSIEVGISDAFKGVLDETEKRWVCITKNDLYEELVFSLTERGILDIPSTLLDQIEYKILRTLDGTSLEFKEVGIDKNGVIQYEEIAVTPQYVYLVELYKNNWKKYYLLQANSDYKNRLKIQCLSDWVERKDSLDFSIFIKKYTQWIGRKEYLRTSDWS